MGSETQTGMARFSGVNQSTDGFNMAMQYADEAYNADVTGGSLSPVRTGLALEQTLETPIETLAILRRRYHVKEDERDLLVAISAGSVYTKLLDHDDPWIMQFTGLQESRCDWLTYEINVTGSDSPTDVLLFTNAIDGMHVLYGDSLKVRHVDTPEKFGVIARFNERIWGSGIKDQPDKLMYSAPYDPLDWAARKEIPEDGAGDILLPTWDGDSFVGLKPFGSYLLAFKRNAIWKIYGTHPGEFAIAEQYGGGTIAEKSVAISTAYCLMMGWSGILLYDGGATEPFQQMAIRRFMQRVNFTFISKACGAMVGKKYLLALPIDGSDINNAIIQYDFDEKTWSIFTGIFVESFLVFDARAFYTSSTAPGTLLELFKGDPLPLTWVSAFQDFGRKDVTKSNFGVYLIAEGEKAYVPLTLRIKTEKKTKEKLVTLASGKAKRININNQGRYFRLEIESNAKYWWRLNAGVQLLCELDQD